MPVPPDPATSTQKQVGDWAISYVDWSFKCDNRHSTVIGIVDRHNQDAKPPPAVAVPVKKKSFWPWSK